MKNINLIEFLKSSRGRLALTLAFLLALTPASWSATVNVNTVAQLVSAVNNGSEGDVINIAAGTYELPASLTPRSGMSIKGAGVTNTILKPASSWNPGTVNTP